MSVAGAATQLDLPPEKWSGTIGRIWRILTFAKGLSVKLAEHEQAWPGPVGSNFWVGAAGTLFWLDPVNDLIAIYLVQTLNLNENFIRWATVRSLFYQDYGMDGSNAATCLG